MSVPSMPGGRPSMPAGPAGIPSIPGSVGIPGTAPDTDRAADRVTVTVATFDDYASAQSAVDYLSDNQFPVERTAIVGTDLRLVEYVLGRLTTARAALAGAASGAWFGLLIGLLFGIFSVSAWWRVLIAAVLIATAWGAIFGAIAHAMTGGRRDFTSRSSLQASHYAVTTDAEVADQARQLLTRLTWQSAQS